MIEILFEKEKNMFYKLKDFVSFFFQTFRLRKLSLFFDFSVKGIKNKKN